MPASLVLRPQTPPRNADQQVTQVTAGGPGDRRFSPHVRLRRQECLCYKNAAVVPRDKLFDGPVAQLDRASAFEAEGWGFEPLRAHHLIVNTVALELMPGRNCSKTVVDK
jgi:hypothetical protein